MLKALWRRELCMDRGDKPPTRPSKFATDGGVYLRHCKVKAEAAGAAAAGDTTRTQSHQRRRVALHERLTALHRKIDYEVVFYFTVYILYLIYGLWTLLKVRQAILRAATHPFAAGWALINRPRDDSNDELENFGDFIASMWHWYVVHAVVSTATWLFWPTQQLSALTVVCAAAVWQSMQSISVLALALLLGSYYCVALLNSKRCTWTLAIVWMAVINLIKSNDYLYDRLGFYEFYTLIIALSWSLLRCCSFNLSRIHDASNGAPPQLLRAYTLQHFLGYTLYFPTLVYGPFLEFRRYAVALQTPGEQQRRSEFRTQALTFVWSLARVAFWWCGLQVALHFLYVHYMARDVTAVGLVTPVFGLHAVGYFMGQFFFLYYVITYGLGIAYATYDGLRPPHRPRCIGRIHFYSDMWKYFDEGLYEFLFKHIYSELCGKESPLYRKLFATATTFSFVFVWHGCYMYVLIWSALNFGCLVAENFFKVLMRSTWYTVHISRYFGRRGTERVRALLATQIFIPAAFSNVYFISGLEVGNYLMRGAYLSGFWNYAALTFCSYCFFQCSEYILKRRA